MESPLLSARSLAHPPRLIDFSMDLYPGRPVGLLGANGSGKSSALALLSGALAPEQGELKLSDETETPPAIGWLPQHSPLYPDMRVIEQLRFSAGLQGRREKQAIDKVLQAFDLGDLQKRLCGHLSGGEQRRVALACALVHEPQILLLDEPSSGLDLEQATMLRNIIQDLTAQHALLIASHQAEDIQGICTSVHLMSQGRLIGEHPLQALHRYRLARFTHAPSEEALCEVPGVAAVLAHAGDGLLIQLHEDAPASMPEKIACRGWGLQSWEQPPVALLAQLETRPS